MDQFPTRLTAAQQEVVPGPCPPEGCPDPTELVCIQVDKIYDACSQRHCFEDIVFEFSCTCEVEECRVVPDSFEFECNLAQAQEDPPLVRASLSFSFLLEVTCDGETETRLVESTEFIGIKQVILFGLADEMFCKVEAVLECLGCDVMHVCGETRIECDVGVLLEIKTAAHVQLLVPSYGFCPIPPDCEELPSRCDEFLTGPPPRRFPPQPFEVE